MLYDSLVVRKWVPDPAEIFIDSVPFGKTPPSEWEGKYLCSITFAVGEVVKLSRKQQVTMFRKVLETLEEVTRMQKIIFKKCFALRYNDENGNQLISFFIYSPKKFPYSR